jgi:hypothetical protein
MRRACGIWLSRVESGGFGILISIYSGRMNRGLHSAMPTDTTQEKQQVHELIDRLAPNQVTAVRGLLEVMIDSVARVADDEPVTEEDRRRLHDGQAWFAKRGGKGIPMEEVLSEFGLKSADISLNK